MTSFEDFYKHLLQFDKGAMVEGEIAGRTVYVMHVHEGNAERTIKLLDDVYGARVFDIQKPEDMKKLTDEDLEKLTPEQRKAYEKAVHQWAFRIYIPPSSDERVFITSEIIEKFVEQMAIALKYDPEAISRALMTNYVCDHTLVENHPTIRGNAMWDPRAGKSVPSISAWGVLNGLIEAVTGERLTFKTRDDTGDLQDIAEGRDPIVKVLRKTH